MRLFLSSGATAFTVYLIQNFDILTIIREFGFPISVAIVMFFYFNKQMTRKDVELLEYRKQTLDSLNDQTIFLKKLLDEARAANDSVCKFTQNK